MKTIITMLVLTVLGSAVSAQNIKLPAPKKSGGKALMDCLNERQTDRNFDSLKKDYESMSVKELEKVKKEIEKNMHKAAAELNFEEAAALRDKMIEINQYFYENK